jgi:hypothetical protein
MIQSVKRADTPPGNHYTIDPPGGSEPPGGFVRNLLTPLLSET